MAKNRKEQQSEMEEVEAERETVDRAFENADRQDSERQGAKPGPDIPGHEQQGVTNRPLAEEERQQSKLPPRGESKNLPSVP
jgi:hypothetical protein